MNSNQALATLLRGMRFGLSILQGDLEAEDLRFIDEIATSAKHSRAKIGFENSINRFSSGPPLSTA